jgi:hypothetical protein
MLFQVVHTHTNETCPGRSPEQTKILANFWQNLKKASGVKVVSGYVSPLDHTFYITVEADDYPTLAKAQGIPAPFLHLTRHLTWLKPARFAHLNRQSAGIESGWFKDILLFGGWSGINVFQET